MGDSIYELLESATRIATTDAANVFGVEIAIVTNVQDPEKQGRVKVCFPRLSGLPESSWARVAQPAAGAGRGFYWIPEVSDEVLVMFECGQANRPYVVGCLWNGKDKPMQDAYADDNSIRMIQTKSGHQIVLSDKAGEEKITISDKSGKRVLTFDVKAKKLLIEGKDGSVELRAKKKIVLDCEDIEIKTKKTGKFNVGSAFDLKVAKTARFEAGGVLNIKATKVDINPSGGAAGAASQSPAQTAAARSFLEISLVDQDNNPYGGQRFRVTASDRTVKEGFLDDAGRARVEDLPAGSCQVSFPDLAADDWSPA